jgi:transposase
MEKQTAVVPDAGEVVRIYLALELSRSSWLVASHTPAADKISRHKLAAGDIDGLLVLIERLRMRVEQKTGQPVQVISCYEAGYDGFWLDRKLKAEGVINHVMDPASIQVNRRARRVKTDAVDAERRCCARSWPSAAVKRRCAAWCGCRPGTRRTPSASAGSASS